MKAKLKQVKRNPYTPLSRLPYFICKLDLLFAVLFIYLAVLKWKWHIFQKQQFQIVKGPMRWFQWKPCLHSISEVFSMNQSQRSPLVMTNYMSVWFHFNRTDSVCVGELRPTAYLGSVLRLAVLLRPGIKLTLSWKAFWSFVQISGVHTMQCKSVHIRTLKIFWGFPSSVPLPVLNLTGSVPFSLN